jgi:hypothetical protein
MTNTVFWTRVNHAIAATGVPVPGAKAYFYTNETSTQITVYADTALSTPLSQPVIADSDGVFAPVYVAGSTAVRVTMTDDLGNAMPGYPMDDIVPLATDVSGASSIPFTPTDDLPYTTVQAAIEGAAGLSTDQTSINARSLTPWTTGGSSDDYTITPSPAITTYAAGQVFTIMPNRDSTGAATLNVNSLGTRNIYKYDASGTPGALIAGDVRAYRGFMVYYDGTQFLKILDQAADASGSGANGAFERRANGWQVCTHSATFAYTTPSALYYEWTFPAAFSAAPNVVGTLPAAGGNFTGVLAVDVGPIRQTATTTVCDCYIYRVAGGAVHEDGDTITGVKLTATGKWY